MQKMAIIYETLIPVLNKFIINKRRVVFKNLNFSKSVKLSSVIHTNLI